jgi:hypothetical protein
METTEQKELLKVLVTRLYQECGVEIEPLYPKVLVRVLPREQATRGGIILPDGAKQNKPVMEGVVLKTYKPFFQKVYVESISWRKDDWDQEATYRQLVKCELQPGDHIIFPHMEFGITPVWPLDDGVGEYRLVPEPVVFGKLEYQTQDMRVWLSLQLARTQMSSLHQAEHILKVADVIRKDIASLTVSGA